MNQARSQRNTEGAYSDAYPQASRVGGSETYSNATPYHQQDMGEEFQNFNSFNNE